MTSDVLRESFAGTPRRRGLWAYLSADAISATGTAMSMLAVPWFVLITTGSATLTGVVAFAQTLPYVIVLGAGGPLVDRLGARRVAIGTDVIAALTVATIPVLHQLDRLPLAVLIVLVAIEGGARGAGTATYVLLPGVAAEAHAPIERASGLHSSVNRVATMVGAPLAGVLMAIWSAPVVLFVDAATFLVAGALIGAFIDRQAEPPRSEPPEGSTVVGHYVSELRDGLSFLRADRLLMAIAVMVFATNLLDQAYGAVLVPVWVRDTLNGPLALGLISGMFGVGAAVGAGVFAWLGPRLSRRRTLAWGFLVCGAPRFFVLAATVLLPPVLTVSLIAGLAAGSINPAISSTEYERVPRALQARVLGALAAIAWAGVPLGALLGGFAVDTVGLTATLVTFGVAYAVITLSPFVMPVWRDMDRPTGTAGTAGTAESVLRER